MGTGTQRTVICSRLWIEEDITDAALPQRNTMRAHWYQDIVVDAVARVQSTDQAGCFIRTHYR